MIGASLCIVAGILLGIVIAPLGIAVWLLGTVAPGHALAIHLVWPRDRSGAIEAMIVQRLDFKRFLKSERAAR